MPTTVRSIGYSNAVQRLVWSGPNGVITAHLWGGGGGAGGSDAAGQGGNGSGSAYTNYAFSVTAGDIIDVAVGGAGTNGLSGVRNRGGGSAGASYVGGTNLLDTRTSPATPPVFPYSNSVYCSFLNTYGVWNSSVVSAVFDRTYTTVFPITAYYTFTVSVDNNATIFLDNVNILEFSQYNSTGQVTVLVTAGVHNIRIYAVNTGGPGSVALVVSNTASFSGGGGGNAGTAGSSGGGGGGGGATAVFHNNNLVAVAGGGGGGGGAGFAGNGGSSPGTAGNTYNGNHAGQNGQNKDGDGGGGGGGGGGLAGGNGGATPNGDIGGLAGSYGTSTGSPQNPTGVIPGGTSSPYYITRVGTGGTVGQSAGAGLAALAIDTGGTYVYSNTWLTAKNIYARHNNQWQTVKTTYVNDNGVWKPVIGGVEPAFTGVPNTIGVGSRPFF